MNYSTLHTHKPTPKTQNKHTTKRLTEDQVRLLESNFDSSKKLDPERKQQLSLQLGIPPRQIAIWYQNKRARWKNQSLEHDYVMLRLQLEATLASTTQLQKEVNQLRSELNKIQAEQVQHDYKHYNNINRPLVDYSVSVYGDDVRSSSRSVEDDVSNLYCFGEQVFDGEGMHVGGSMMGSDLGLFGSREGLF